MGANPDLVFTVSAICLTILIMTFRLSTLDGQRTVYLRADKVVFEQKEVDAEKEDAHGGPAA